MSTNWLLLTPNSPHSDSVITLEPQDFYQFQWEQPGSLKLSITGLTASVDFRLSNVEGQLLQAVEMDETGEGIFLNDLLPGPYFLEILRRDRDTNYILNLDPITGLTNLFADGMSQDTPLTIEIAYGDKKDRELGIFSLEGMDKFVLNTPAYFQEAARRVLSQSNWGQLLISNFHQSSSLIADSFEWENQVNNGVAGVKFRTSQTVNLLGEQFGFMIVPKGTIQEVWENPNVSGNNRPSFSFGERTGGGFHFREENLNEGTLFTIEREGGFQDNDGNGKDIFVYVGKPPEEAEVTQPITTEPEITEPVATEPEITEPVTTEPEITEPVTTEPEITEPVATEPEVSEPVTTESEIPKPVAIELEVSEPVATEPDITEPVDIELEIPAIDNLEPLPSREVEVPPVATPGENNIPPKDLRVTLENQGWGNPVTIAGTVRDRNGFSDIQRIELSVHIQGEAWRAIASVTDFTPDPADDTTANFTYDWTEQLGAGNYKIKAVAYDRAGKTSNVVIEQLTLLDTTPPIPPITPITPITPTLPNSQPSDLRFSLFPLYTTGEILSFEGGKIYDSDGIEDLSSIEFSIRKIGEDWVYAGEVTEFTQDAEGYGRFGFSYDLNNLTPGSYELRSVAYDRQGATSNIATETFVVITDPGGEGLSADLKLDIAGAANLERYTQEELANTQKWVVWVTPGQSADQLAASVNAVNLGETGHIPNTYLWEFGDKPKPKTTPESIANLLTELDGVEFAYPEVPVPLKLMNPGGKKGFQYPQWHLEDAVNPNIPSSVTAAWNIINSQTDLPVLGRNVVIGFVDDGVDYTHPDLLPRYNPNLSFDFSDLDDDPFPRSQQKFEEKVSKPTIQGNRAWLAIPVNLTGLVTNLDFNLEFKGQQGVKLAEDARFTLHSPTNVEQDPFDWQSFGGYWWRYPGWEESRSNNNKILPIQRGNRSVNIALQDHFNGIYAGGYWHLEISVNAYDHPDPPKFLQNLTNQIKSWSLDLTAINPHGTLVTGVGVADGMRLYGVAPEAEFAAIRLIGNIDPVNYSYDSQGYLIADALYDAKNSGDSLNRNDGIAIFNNSWGPQYMRQLPLATAALASGFKSGRNGLGNSYVFSVGNDGAEIGHVNYNNLANSLSVIAVGAISRNGILSNYSTQAPFVVAYSDSGKPDNNGISTTATTLKNQMVTDFGGTSAAAPFVSGAIALMLEVNPDLTSRDIQHILAKTAYKTDPTHADWQQNGGGYHINRYYGFGAVDPVAAVMAAKDWITVGEQVKVTGDKELKNVLSQIRDDQKITDAIAIDQNITVEHTEVLVNINHPDWKDLTLTLKSPDGTESRLMNFIGDDPYGIGKTYEVHPGSNHWTFTSVRHWGESSQGEWTLEVHDQKGNKIEGEWLSWQLNLYGTEPVITLEATQPNASEDGTPGQFTLTRTGNTKNPLTVNYTIEGTATNGEDYQPLTGTVTFAAGSNTAVIDILPIYDTLFDEEDETVILTLIDNSGYATGPNNSDIVVIANYTIPLNHWNAQFINRTPENVSDRSTYDFSNPAATLDLGYQSNNGIIRLFQSWGLGSPDSAVQNDYFAMEAWTRANFEAGQLYKITTQSDDGVWFRVKNVETGEWIDDSVVLGDDGADWRTRGTGTPPRTIFFKVPETGEYDFYIDYFENLNSSSINVTVEPAQFFQDPVNPASEWHSSFYWWDRKLGNQPAGDFFATGGDPSHAIGVVNLGSDTRPDGKKGIRFDWGESAALGDVRLPDNNFAIRGYTEENLEAGRQYRVNVGGDDGFQLSAKNLATNEWVYITPQNQWQQQYGGLKRFDFTVPEDGVYQFYFDFYEERGDVNFDLSWEPVNFIGTTLSTIGANVRSGPGVSFEKVNEYPYDTFLRFDKWTEGDFVDYSAELGTSSSLWYRIAGTNHWISAAIIDGEPSIFRQNSSEGGATVFITAEAI